ncbi:Xcc1710-like domain-containing protein [Ectothiorhodospiraceae bacterium 2226]|nr:Xcc1710-like domain-containing protein [Ectothiorhodospiraceae bacterium 2226]
MKFNLEAGGGYQIVAYEEGRITVAHAGGAPATPAEALGGQRETVESSVVVTPSRLIRAWPPERFEDLAADHFAMLEELDPEVVLFGSGARLRFPAAGCTAPLAARQIGVEVMDTAAACRTFNILAAEGRRVAAALLMIEAA